jgi:hypothetical protein
MISARSLILIFLILTLSDPVNGMAGESCLSLTLRRLYRDTRQMCIDMIVNDDTGRTLALRSLDGGRLISMVELIEGIGKGCRGNVYRFTRNGEYGNQVLKISRSYRVPVTKGRAAVIEDGLHSEASITREVISRIQKIEKAPSFPKDPSWSRGRIPVVPILEEYDSELGRVLIKPEVSGMKRLIDFKLTPKGRLPEAVEKSLKEIYDLRSAIHEAVPPFESGKMAEADEGLFADIGGGNLFWVESTEKQKEFGMKRPGLMLFELDRSSMVKGGEYFPNFNTYPTWESYRDNILKTLILNQK